MQAMMSPHYKSGWYVANWLALENESRNFLLDDLNGSARWLHISYSLSYACFDCRKAFKRSLGNASPAKYPLEMICPNCSGIAVCLGLHFKAPRASDKKQWKKVQFLVENGFRFQKIRLDPKSVISIPYPKTLEEAEEFVVRYKAYSLKQDD